MLRVRRGDVRIAAQVVIRQDVVPERTRVLRRQTSGPSRRGCGQIATGRFAAQARRCQGENESRVNPRALRSPVSSNDFVPSPYSP